VVTVLTRRPGVAVGVAGDQRPELDPLGDAGGETEGGVPFEHRPLGGADRRDLEEVVHHPEGIEPGGVGGAGDVGEGRADGGGAARLVEDRDLDTDAHRASSCVVSGRVMTAGGVPRRLRVNSR
jgi:hypothetical protein